MPNKKLSKNYFGIPLSPIDDATVFSLPLNGDVKDLISGKTINLGTSGSFKPMPTGLGYKFNADTVIPINVSGLSSTQGTIDFVADFDSIRSTNGGRGGVVTLRNINNQPSIQIYILTTADGSTGVVSGNILPHAYFTENTTPSIGSSLASNFKTGLHHIRLCWTFGSAINVYVDGKLIGSTAYATTQFLAPTQVIVGAGSYVGDNPNYYPLKGAISDLSISNIDRGAYFPTLPQDFIDQQATIKPAFSSQRSVYSDALYSETRSTIVRIGNNEKQFTNSRTTGNWTNADTIKVKGMGGEIIGGVIDTDTALARALELTTGWQMKLDDVSKLAVNDTFYFYNSVGVSDNIIRTISAIDTTNKIITYNGTGDGGSMVGGLLFETTASTSSPLVKTNITGTAQAGASTTITLPTTFSAVDSAYNNYDIMITSGTGIGQRKTISAYVGSTKVATVPAWTVTPNATSVFVIYNTPVTGTWSALGTNEATFTLGTNATLINQDIIVDYSLNEVAGQGQIELFTATKGGEYNGRKLVVGTVAVRDDFVGKISGSVVECPHISKYQYAPTLPTTPSAVVTENTQTHYDQEMKLDGVTKSSGTLTSTYMAQQLKSFNIIRSVEDKFGEIQVLDKVKWCKDNIKSITANWYGYGSCPSGNKAYLDMFNATNNYWHMVTNVVQENYKNTASTPSVVSINTGTPCTNFIDDNAFIHFLAYTNASDGTTASTIYTDYIYLDVTLNTPTTHDVLVPENPRRDSKFGVKSSDLVVVDDFDGKISGDVGRVGHVMKEATATTLTAPSSFSNENGTATYGYVSALDGVASSTSTSTNLTIAQRLFSKNLIRIVEDKYGVIPVVDKVSWLKANIGELTLNWTGYGSCPSGNKANLKIWNNNSSAWAWRSESDGSTRNTSNYPTLLSLAVSYWLSTSSASTNIANSIDTNGFVHFLAYTDASDGVTASTINTDYINIQVTLKDSALIQLPYLRSKLGNENVLMVRKETKEVATFFKSNNDAKVAVYGEWNKPNVTLVGSTLTGGTILSSLKVFLTSVSTRLSTGSVYNPKTKFDILDSFSIIDSTISSANGNGLNLYVNSSYTNLVSNLLETKLMGYSSANKGIKIGKINSCSNTTLQLEDSTGNTVLYLNQNDINNSVANYIPIACFLAKNINNEIVLVMCGCNATSKGQISLDGTNNGRIVVFSLPNKPLIK